MKNIHGNFGLVIYFHVPKINLLRGGYQYMASKKNSQTPKNDFEYDNGEVYGFTENTPIIGDCIASFSFVDGCIIETTKPNLESQSNDNATTLNNKTITENKNAPINNLNIQTNTTDPIEIKNISSPTKDIFDNRRTPLPNRATPPIDGETPTIKRTYILRDSTIRKIIITCTRYIEFSKLISIQILKRLHDTQSFMKPFLCLKINVNYCCLKILIKS